MNLRRSIILSAALLAVAACADPTGPTGPDPVVDLAYINAPGDGPAVSVDSDGGELVVEITTWGLNTCYSHNRDEVDVDSDARVITIRPYNEHPDPEQRNVVCGHAIVEILHRMEIDPDASGDWLVRVIGKPMRTNGPTEIVVEIQITVS